MQGADRDEFDVRDVEARGKVLVRRDDFVETVFSVVDQVHLVHAHHHVTQAEQGCDEAVAVGLLEQTVTGIDEDDREVGGGGAGHHVSGVLDVTRSVGDDELALGRGEVAVGDVDGDALFALRLEAVREEAEVGAVDAFLA